MVAVYESWGALSLLLIRRAGAGDPELGSAYSSASHGELKDHLGGGGGVRLTVRMSSCTCTSLVTTGEQFAQLFKGNMKVSVSKF